MTTATQPTPTWTVYYRRGGTDNFSWHKVLEQFPSVQEAAAKAQGLTKVGYRALYEETALLNSIGLPETFAASEEVSR